MSISVQSNLISTTPSVTSQSATPPQTATQTISSTSAYGPAVNVDLSDAAQAVLASQNAQSTSANPPKTIADAIAPAPTAAPATDTDTTASSSTSDTSSSASSDSTTSSGSSSSTSSSKPSAPHGGGGGGVTVSETETDVEKAKEEVAAQVGIVAANELVDSKGNIDKVGLAQELAKQAQEAAELTATTNTIRF